MSINFKSPGRMINGTKKCPKGHTCVFNANVCTKGAGKFWFGDLDLMDDEKQLLALAAEKGEPVYVLREQAARFTTEANPRFDDAVRIYHPNGKIEIPTTGEN